MWCNFAWRLAVLSAVVPVTIAQPVSAPASTNPPPIVLTVEGTNVTLQRFATKQWENAFPNQVLAPKDRGRTGLRSRASVRLSDLSILRLAELSEFEIQPLQDSKAEAEFSLFRGLIYLLNRDRPGKHRFVTPTATAATRGTEFTLEVEERTGKTMLAVLEGEAELSNAAGSVIIGPGEQGTAVLGEKPTKTAILESRKLVQWCLYYPGILNLDELPLSPDEKQILAPSIEAYRSGDLLAAVSRYPAGRTPASDAERIFAASLLLSVGQAAQAEARLQGLASGGTANSVLHQLAGALRTVIDAVSSAARADGQTAGMDATVSLNARSTELLARSYAQQAVQRLDDALLSARLATRRAPDFAFAWARVAELEFSFGGTREAMLAVDRSLQLAPRNAQAIALKGFLLSAQNKVRDALPLFDEAIRLDGGLGNAWLGRGLAKIRMGQSAEGRFDLHAAALTEPRRSLLRSYLGKAWSNDGDAVHAAKELRLARELDAGDPTPWLYSALLLQQQNRINDGIRDLETSRRLNDNRSLYRSRLLLDQDRAVSGANLANLYADAGMVETSAREAGRAVSADYANHSAHRFLADSFHALRDPSGFNQRYESAWFTEYLLANLLSPVGAGTLSQTVSQQEYARLFDGDRFGFTSATGFESHGAWEQKAVQHGQRADTAYAAELFFRSDDGWRANNDLERRGGVVEIKHQLTARDRLYLHTAFSEMESGDLGQYYRQSNGNRGLRVRDELKPLLLAGFQREWNPGHHTLAMLGVLQNEYSFANPTEASLFLDRGLGGPIREVALHSAATRHERELTGYSVELQHIWLWNEHATVAGGRWQAGDLNLQSSQTDGVIILDGARLPTSFTSLQDIESSYDHSSLYLYDHWKMWPTLTAVAGVTYDQVRLPNNFRLAPLGTREETRDRVSPKAGLVWTPRLDTSVRAGYFESLGGVDAAQSVRLEPSQIAGFNQAFRNLAPQSVLGANDGVTIKGWLGAVEHTWDGRTFVGLSGELLSSGFDRDLGVVNFAAAGGAPFFSSQTVESVEYKERALALTVDQLIGSDWTVGARYRVSTSELDRQVPEIPELAILHSGVERRSETEAVLHQVQIAALYNHSSGFFGRGWGTWLVQSNQGYTTDIPGDNFWQFNVELGWRFLQRRVEARVALLNLTDQDYRLNPLNLMAELPRDRELVASLRFNF